jgi:hypothetical protein
MNTRIAIAIAALAALLDCSTPHTAQTTQPATPAPPLLDLAPGYELRDGQLVPRVLIPPDLQARHFVPHHGFTSIRALPAVDEALQRQGNRATARCTGALDRPRASNSVSLTRYAAATSCG